MHLEDIKDEGTLVSMIKTSLQNDSIESFRSEVTRKIKKINKSIKTICKDEYEGYMHIMTEVPKLETNLDSITEELSNSYAKIYVLILSYI
jgi:uncharacterized protein Yka (UPF0111/DUF47 family)